jgi:hypothetical protein
MYTKDPGLKVVLKSLKHLTLIQDPTRLLEQFDLVIQVGAGLGELSEECKDKGKTVLGGTFNDRLEEDESYSNSVVSMLLKNPLKVPDTPPLPISITGWFNQEEFTLFNYSFNYTKFLEHDRGVDKNSGSVVWIGKDRDKLIFETLLKLTPLLQKVKYLGPITMNVICFQEEKIFLSFNTFITPTFFPYLELLKCSTWDLLWKCTQLKQEVSTREQDVALSVVLSLPPYPYNFNLEIRETESYLNVPEPAKSHTHLLPEAYGFIGCITSRGEGSNEARRRLYRTINNIVLNQTVQYRSDIGYGVEERINQLKKWEWLS